MRVEVTTLSKRPQSAAHAAAAVFVITQDDIRRSGAATLPEALRLAPGLTVAQIDANTWAVGARGDVGRFANKLLVLMDGRTLYTPTYGGVYWDVQDTVIADVERIEVILGPGGAIWGANAVNGVISIITKNAAQTQGLLTSADVDFDGGRTFDTRYGASSFGSVDWRVYARHIERGHNELQDGSTSLDALEQNRVGARADWRVTSDHQITSWFEAYEGTSTHAGYPLLALKNDLPIIAAAEEVDGVSTRLAGNRDDASGWHLQWQATYDHFDREGGLYNETRDTLELGIEQVPPRFGMHALIWGISARLSSDRITRGSRAFALPLEDETSLVSGFLQDEIFLFEDRASVTIGTKYEQDDATGSAFMPSLRMRYSPQQSTTLWAGLSRGTRTPARGERTVHLTTNAAASPLELGQDLYPIPLFIHADGNPQLRDEEVTTYELGARHAWHDSVLLDISTFYNRYHDLRGTAPMTPGCRIVDGRVTSDLECMLSPTYIAVPVALVNAGSAIVRGGESRLTWNATAQWQLFASYAFLDRDDSGRTAADYLSGFDPDHQALLRSTLSLSSDWEWDVSVRYSDVIALAKIPSYIEANTRLAWRPRLDLELAVIGNNLLRDSHPEFRSELADMPLVALDRNIALQVRWWLR
jgi:iron complex outermembrane receptor protein